MGYTFEERLNALRSRKEEQTKEKIRRNGYMDEDDYGCVPPPEDFVFHPECNDKEHGTFYGAELWGRNFRRLMEAHPVYVDANDALAGRWMFILQRMRPFESVTSTNNMEMAPIFDYSWLKPVQNKYALVPGIGKMHHFGGDYQIGLDLGWYGLLDKVERYSRENTDEEAQELYAAEKDGAGGIRPGGEEKPSGNAGSQPPDPERPRPESERGMPVDQLVQYGRADLLPGRCRLPAGLHFASVL